jgi:hypothetical protein
MSSPVMPSSLRRPSTSRLSTLVSARLLIALASKPLVVR